MTVRRPAQMTVGGRVIGAGAPCFVVAEAGVNHNGDVELAKRLVEEAAAAGADAVKFQTWQTDAIVTEDAPLAAYQAENLGGGTSQSTMLRELELTPAELADVKAHADANGILFFSAADDEQSADALADLDVELFKIGSGELTNLRLLAHVAAKGKPMIVSTGMADLGEVEAAVRAIEDAGCRELALLHCVSLYPAPAASSNLRAMDTLAAAFPYPVGFSDHTPGAEVALAAVALGACILEKHLTLDRTMVGPDHRVSLDPEEFARLVADVRRVEAALGDGRKQPVPGELETRKLVRRVLVAARRLEAGERLRPDDVALRRAADGLPADALERLVGRRLRVDLPAGSPLTTETVE